MIPEKVALLYASSLGIGGFSLLIWFTNYLTACIAFVGFFFYLIMYSIWKRRSELGTVVGSISGAVPPVVGYCAVTNQFDLGAFLLFMVLVFWQMPHFYSIAIFRSDEYAAASIPVLPITKGVFNTKFQMIVYIFAFIIAVWLLTIFHYTGIIFLIVIETFGIWWLYKTVEGLYVIDTKHWARGIFSFSLLVIVMLSIMLSLTSVLI